MGSSPSAESDRDPNIFLNGQDSAFQSSVVALASAMNFKCSKFKSPEYKNISDTTIYDIFSAYKRLTTEKTQTDVVKNVLIPLICENTKPEERLFEMTYSLYNFELRKSLYFLETFENRENNTHIIIQRDKIISPSQIWRTIYDLHGIDSLDEKTQFCRYAEKFPKIKLNFATVEENDCICKYVHEITSSDKSISLIGPSIKWGFLTGDISLILKICSFGPIPPMPKIEKTKFQNSSYIHDFIKPEKESGRFSIEKCRSLKGHSSIVATSSAVILLDEKESFRLVGISLSESIVNDYDRYYEMPIPISANFIVSVGNRFVIGNNTDKITFGTINPLRFDKTLNNKVKKYLVSPMCSDGRYIYSMSDPDRINVLVVEGYSIMYVKEIPSPKLLWKKELDKVVMISDGIVIQLITFLKKENNIYVHRIRTVSAWNGNLIADVNIELDYIVDAATYEPLTKTVWIASKFSRGCGLAKYKYEGPDSPALTGFNIQKINISVLTNGIDWSSNDLQYKIPAGLDNLIAPILGADLKAAGFNKDVYAMFQHGCPEDVIDALLHYYEQYLMNHGKKECVSCIWTCLASISLYARTGKMVVNSGSAEKLCFLLRRVADDEQFKQSVLYTSTQIFEQLFRPFPELTAPMFTYLCETSSPFQIQFLINRLSNSKLFPLLINPQSNATLIDRMLRREHHMLLFMEASLKATFREMLDNNPSEEIKNAANSLSESIINSVIKNIQELAKKESYLKQLFDEFLFYIKAGYNNFLFVQSILPKLLNILKIINKEFDLNHDLFIYEGEFSSLALYVVDVLVSMVMAMTGVADKKVPISDISYLIFKSSIVQPIKPKVTIDDVYKIAKNILNRKMSANDKDIELKIFTVLSHHLSTPIEMSEPIVKRIYKIRGNIKASKQKTVEYNEGKKERPRELIENYEEYIRIMTQKIDFLLSRTPFFSSFDENNLEMLSQFITNGITLDVYIRELRNLDDMKLAINESLTVLSESTKIQFFDKALTAAIFGSLVEKSKILTILSECKKINTTSIYPIIQNICNDMFRLIIGIPTPQTITFTSMVVIMAMETFGAEAWGLMGSLFESVVLTNVSLKPTSFNTIFTTTCCIQKSFINNLGQPLERIIKKEIGLAELLPPYANLSMTIAASMIMAGIPNDIMFEISIMLTRVDADDFHPFCNFLYELFYRNEKKDLTMVYEMCLSIIGSIICGSQSPILCHYEKPENINSNKFTKAKTSAVTIMMVVEMAQVMRRILPKSRQLQGMFYRILERSNVRESKMFIKKLAAVLFILSNAIIVPLPSGIVTEGNQPYFIKEIHEKTSMLSVISLPITSRSTPINIVMSPSLQYDTLIRFNPSNFKMTDILIPIFKQSLMPSTTYYESIINFFAMTSLREYISDVDTGEDFSRKVTSVLGSKLSSFQFRRFSDTAISLIQKSLNSKGDGMLTIPHKVAKMEHASYVDFNEQSMFTPSDSAFITSNGYHVYMSTVLDPQNRTYFSIKQSQARNIIIGVTTLSLDSTQVTSVEYHSNNKQFTKNGRPILMYPMDFNEIELMFDPIMKKVSAAVDKNRHRILRVDLPESFVCFFAVVPPNSYIPFRLAMTPAIDNFKKKVHAGLIFHPVKAIKRIIQGPVKDVMDGSQEFRLLKDHEEGNSGEELVKIITTSRERMNPRQYLRIREFQPFDSATNIFIGLPTYFKSAERPTIWSTMVRMRRCIESDTYGNLSFPRWEEAKMCESLSIPAIHFKNMTKLPQDVINTLFSGIVERHRIENLTLLMARSVTTSINDAIREFGLELDVIVLYLMNVSLLFEDVNYDMIPSKQLPLQMSVSIFSEGNTCSNAEMFDHWNAARIIFNAVKENMPKQFIQKLSLMVNERFNDPSNHFIKSANCAAIGARTNQLEIVDNNASGFLVCKQEFNNPEFSVNGHTLFFYTYSAGTHLSYYSNTENFVALPITRGNGNTVLFGTFIELAVWWKYLVLLTSELAGKLDPKFIDGVKLIARKNLYWSIAIKSPFFAMHSMELLGFIDSRMPPNPSLISLVEDIRPIARNNFEKYIEEQSNILEFMKVTFISKYYTMFGGDTNKQDEGDFIVPGPTTVTDKLNRIKRVLGSYPQPKDFPFYLLLRDWAMSMLMFPPASIEVEDSIKLKITFTVYIPYAITLYSDDICADRDVKVTTGGKSFRWPSPTKEIKVKGPNVIIEFQSDISNVKFYVFGTDKPSEAALKQISFENRNLFEEDVKRWLEFKEHDDQIILSRIRTVDGTRAIDELPTILKLTELPFPLHFLYVRMLFLFNFNTYIAGEEAMEGQEMAAYARYASIAVMADRFRNALMSTESSARLYLKIDRRKGLDVRNGVSNKIGDSMIAQLARAYHSKEQLRTCQNPFHVEYLNEAGIDCGGLSRDFMNELVRDIASERIGLFVVTPNARNRVGEFQDCIVPAPQSGKKLMHLYETVGALLAVTVRSGFVQTFSFPPLFWKYLADGQITINDIFDIDNQYKELIDSLTCDMTSEEFDARFNIINTVKNIAGVDTPLGTERRRVTKATVTRYISSANALRLEELLKPLQWIKNGFWNSLGIPKLPYVSATMLEFMACGERTIDLQKLQKLTEFSIPSSDSRDLFWVLARFDDAHRRMFLQFATGTSSIPINAQYPFMHVVRGVGGDDMLPTAATCFFRFCLPKYSSRAVMYQRILTAIEYGGSFEFS